MTIKTMTDAELAKAARNYDRVQNEGGEGYNPYTEEQHRRASAAEAARPKSRQEQMSAIIRRIDTLDCSIARESGTYDAARVAALRADLARLKAADDAEFAAVWRREVFEAKRAAWNDAMRALPGFASGKVRHTDVADMCKRLGIVESDLRRAKEMYK